MESKLTASFVSLLLGGALAATIKLTTPNIYNRYVELVDHHFDIRGETSFYFQVKVKNDGFVGLAQTYGVWDNNFYEILLSGYGEQEKLGIRNGRSAPLEASLNKPGLVGGDFYATLWVKWDEGRISVGTGIYPGVAELLSWTDPEPHTVNYVLISSGFGATGYWIFNNKDGGWSDWGEWSRCILQPDGQRRDQRTRTCDNPLPKLGGSCPGNEKELDQLKPCSTDFFWYVLQTNSKVTQGQLTTVPVRSRIDCCRVCQQTSACEGVSYDGFALTCVMASVYSSKTSLNQEEGWETWVRK